MNSPYKFLKLQLYYTSCKIFSKLKEFISSCQSEVNAFGHQNHQHLQDFLEETEANIMGVPAYMFLGDADDYDEYCINRRMAEGLHSVGI